MKADPQTDTLVNACLEGEAGAQRKLYGLYVQAMYNVAIRMLGNPADAEDIVQEAFISVFQQLSSFKGKSTLGAWIKKITVNAALNHLRKRKLLLFAEPLPIADPMPPEQLEPTLSVEHIHRAIQQLPAGCRTVINLHLIEGYQHQEIAEILQISVSTSKSQYHRAKKLLRPLLQQNKNQKNSQKVKL